MSSDLGQMPSDLLARRLEELAIRARSSSEQMQLMQEGLHHTLPHLLARAPDGPQQAPTWRMKAQAARLMANLAYQPSHKGEIVGAGGLRALANAAREAMPQGTAVRDGEEEATDAAAALLLEAAAAMGNLASGADARRAIVGAESGISSLLARMLTLAPPGHVSVASEAARALSNLSLCSSTHARIVEGGAPQCTLPLLLRCTPLGARVTKLPAPAHGFCECCAQANQEAEAEEEAMSAAAAAGEVVLDDAPNSPTSPIGGRRPSSFESDGSDGGGAPTYRSMADTEHAGAAEPRALLASNGSKAGRSSFRLDPSLLPPPSSIASHTATGRDDSPLLGRLLLMLINLLRHREMAPTLLSAMPNLEPVLLNSESPRPAAAC